MRLRRKVMNFDNFFSSFFNGECSLFYVSIQHSSLIFSLLQKVLSIWLWSILGQKILDTGLPLLYSTFLECRGQNIFICLLKSADSSSVLHCWRIAEYCTSINFINWEFLNYEDRLHFISLHTYSIHKRNLLPCLLLNPTIKKAK